MKLAKIRKALTIGLPMSSHRAPASPGNWGSRSLGPLGEEKRPLTGYIPMEETDRRVSSLDRPDLQAHSDAQKEMKETWEAQCKDRILWRAPYEWDPLDHINNNLWPKCFLYEPQEQIQRIWLLGDGREERFSHPVKEIPLVQACIKLYRERSETQLILYLSLFFNRPDFNLGVKDIVKDTSILDFILLLATITEVNQRSKEKLDPFSARIQEYIIRELPRFEEKLTESKRDDIIRLIKILKNLWERD
ncbi:hypothetical protein PtA15_12A256 [Puccinia triticina]|uniref:Uncharacterized protein n=1 Tax=Puccinia triticina TaxID=208348 RepID=A0ABY7D0Y5_9BASI|nr:uncharacterized protein PtA15_12A256 [Puccinia triticina]WAQ90268.1 hypothetical protein PtA15_12A256 [Puccinia triticina]WAR61576.1 hypothetical protein PtB15_12B266 [Puccinia triticina]